MRVGHNPHKDQLLSAPDYLHQVVIPVYIPHQEGYFRDSFKILQLCINSLVATVHAKTCISIVNNGSCDEVKFYLNELYEQNIIQELIHTENIGKLNAVLKGIAGNKIPLVTITDADVLFLNSWQSETTKIFNQVPQAGVVGIVPQFKMYESNCGNVLLANLFNKKMHFSLVKNKQALIRFYDSIGWDRNYNQDYLKYNLALTINPELKVLIGSGHFVATYKKDIFEHIVSYIGYKMGGDSEGYLDKLPLKKDYWRLTTQDNYAFHMGNVYEDWMVVPAKNELRIAVSSLNFTKRKPINAVVYFAKNRLFVKFLSFGWMNTLFLCWKKLPKHMIKRY
ncbi:glycosyltransferase family 2 protein [Flavobacterium sp. F-380]|uniref:Glycosyltransferase family 2 protein n=1 Tax=Flavobacterium kayseriense TaxID=2764714 RepID=A0ABR7J7Q1_9FLAO|nr:glycosyltransferase family A protein [Flavobacterium kayseriense]MBC5841433.1 glycosyltransferase family 2 protein [Flavobacterium kayseriense]MBC5847961.1 glycosyltransferase family 2 protein [Flavobacterium kayseriense]